MPKNMTFQGVPIGADWDLSNLRYIIVYSYFARFWWGPASTLIHTFDTMARDRRWMQRYSS